MTIFRGRMTVSHLTSIVVPATLTRKLAGLSQVICVIFTYANPGLNNFKLSVLSALSTT